MSRPTIPLIDNFPPEDLKLPALQPISSQRDLDCMFAQLRGQVLY